MWALSQKAVQIRPGRKVPWRLQGGCGVEQGWPWGGVGSGRRIRTAGGGSDGRASKARFFPRSGAHDVAA